MSEKFKTLEELIKEYYGLVKKNQDGLSPYAKFEAYLSDGDDSYNRPIKIKSLIDCLAGKSKCENDKLNAIMQLWATGGKITVKDNGEVKSFNGNGKRLIHSISNTLRPQVCLKGNEKGESGQMIIDGDNLLKFASAIGKYIIDFKGLKEKHDLVHNDDFKDVLNNNIDAAINEILFWYYYDKDKYPIINSRAKNSRMILNQIFPNDKTSNNTDFNQKCMDVEGFEAIMDGDKIKISKQLMLDQLFYSIDEMKSMKNLDYAYKNNNDNEIYKFYKKIWNTIKDAKVVSNAEFFGDLLTKSKNIILYGAPGTGKTWTSENNIANIIKSNPNPTIDAIRFKKVQFHPSYSYEDFMEGLKPVIKDGSVALVLQVGDFMQFCKEAKEYESRFKEAQDTDKMKFAFFFLVDEINRTELSRVFGETMYALDKRGNKISTQYSYMKDEDFMIPENLYFIGTMNDVDRSIDSFDIALRRRFFWYRMDCDYSVVLSQLDSIYSNIGEFGKEDIPDSGYLKACYDLNQFITENNNLGLGKLYELGHDYFLKIKQHIKESKNNERVAIENKNLKDLFEFSIEPLLREYLRAEYSEDEIEKHLKKAKEVFKIHDSNS